MPSVDIIVESNPILIEIVPRETATIDIKFGQVDSVNGKTGTVSVNEVPNGGTTGQLLAKNSNANNDTKWIDPPSGSTDTYILILGCDAFIPASSTTYYYGLNYMTRHAPSTSLVLGLADAALVPKSGDIKTVFLRVNVWSTVGSSQNATLKVLVYDNTGTIKSTSTVSSTIKFNVSPFVLYLDYNITGLTIPVAAGDSIILQLDTPAWSTSPANVFLNSVVTIQ